MARFWFMSACDQYGNPVGIPKNITDVVLDTAGEDEFDPLSSEQEMAAQAIVESEYGTSAGFYNGTYWTE